MYSRHDLWLRISRTIGIIDASAATAPGCSAAVQLLRRVHDALERVVVVDPRHLEALEELLRLKLEFLAPSSSRAASFFSSISTVTFLHGEAQ